MIQYWPDKMILIYVIILFIHLNRRFELNGLDLCWILQRLAWHLIKLFTNMLLQYEELGYMCPQIICQLTYLVVNLYWYRLALLNCWVMFCIYVKHMEKCIMCRSTYKQSGKYHIPLAVHCGHLQAKWSQKNDFNL